MARIRSIKPEFWVDDKVVELEFADRLLFIGLWNFCDDEGYIQYAPKRIKMMVFPADSVDVSGILMRLRESSLIEVFSSDQGEVLRIRNWDRHQKTQHPGKTKFTGIKPLLSVNAHEDSRTFTPEKEKEKEKDKYISSEVADATARPDVLHLLDALDAEIVRNGAKKPSRTKKNTDAARLLLDRDGKTVEQVERAIKFAQSDEFWRSNVLSMSKLREKYDQLQLAAQRKRGGNVTEIALKPKRRFNDMTYDEDGRQVFNTPGASA